MQIVYLWLLTQEGSKCCIRWGSKMTSLNWQLKRDHCGSGQLSLAQSISQRLAHDRSLGIKYFYVGTTVIQEMQRSRQIFSSDQTAWPEQEFWASTLAFNFLLLNPTKNNYLLICRTHNTEEISPASTQNFTVCLTSSWQQNNALWDSTVIVLTVTSSRSPKDLYDVTMVNRKWTSHF